MPVIHDFFCTHCSAEFPNLLSTKYDSLCPTCETGKLHYLWTSNYSRPASAHSSERVALYYSEKEGKYQYPGRNDRPVPKRLVDRGYVRKEFGSAHELARHERRHNVASHVLNYDRNGRSYDGSDC